MSEKAERPILMFPTVEKVEREKKSGRPNSFTYDFPTAKNQYIRLNSKLKNILEVFEKEKIKFSSSMDGIDPEFALVFEVKTSVEEFYKAVEKFNKYYGEMEFMFDIEGNETEVDENFKIVNKETGEIQSDKKIQERVYCVMTSSKAVKMLFSLWEEYSKEENSKLFRIGTAKFIDIFLQLSNIRFWDYTDRIAETGIIESIEECVEGIILDDITFEIELFYRKNVSEREKATSRIKSEISIMNGKIKKECVIEHILYHCLLVSIPRVEAQKFVENNLENIELLKINDVMFLRPCSQSVEKRVVAETYTITKTNIELAEGDPVIALLDGMPIENHVLLRNNLIIDDPDEFSDDKYQAKSRVHGTSMASLILNGDIGEFEKGIEQTLKRKIYVRPIMKVGINDTSECIPEDEIFIDLVHRSVKRMFEDKEATNIKIINLCICNKNYIFNKNISPLARLIDWLSYKYNVLFIISAGNHVKNNLPSINFNDFKKLSMEERTEKVFYHLKENIRNYKVLSPAESINSLSVGALYSDFVSNDTITNMQLALNDNFPSPISSFGLGYKKTIKPELFYHGGRNCITEDISNSFNTKFQDVSKNLGIKSASPHESALDDQSSYGWGTSHATALITHEAGKCYDVLEQILKFENLYDEKKEFMPQLLKAMLVHGASWEGLNTQISEYTESKEKRITQWFGYGRPDISRVLECEENRITLFGMGELKVNEAHLYKLPIPFNFSSEKLKRKLTVTLAFFVPTSSTNSKYLKNKVWFVVEPEKKEEKERKLLKTKSAYTETEITKRGTLQHEIYEDENSFNWEEEEPLTLKINCSENIKALKKDSEEVKIKYGVFVSFEIAPEHKLNVYSDISVKINSEIKIQTKI